MLRRDVDHHHSSAPIGGTFFFCAWLHANFGGGVTWPGGGPYALDMYFRDSILPGGGPFAFANEAYSSSVSHQ